MVKTLLVALIDTNKDAGGKDKYYNELADNVYRPLFLEDDEVDGDGEDGNVEGGGDNSEEGTEPDPNPGKPDGGDGDHEEGKEPETPPAEGKLDLTSIIEGIVSGDDVWGSGTKTVKESDGSYTVTAAGEGEGSWGGNIAAIPVTFEAGDLDGYEYIVVDGVDISKFTLNDDSEQYPAIELKIGDDEIINATKNLLDDTILISIAKVDAVKNASQIMLSFRGTGTVKIQDISKAKVKE